MPDRDYYLKMDDKALAATRDAYKKYLADMLTHGRLQERSMRARPRSTTSKQRSPRSNGANEDRRDENKIYNPMTFSDLKKLAPQFPWDAYFEEAGIPLTAPRASAR